MAKQILSQGKDGYQRDLGWVEKGEGVFKQPRFLLGKNRAEAQIRNLRLERVWDAINVRWQRDRDTPRPLWDEVTLQIGRAVSRGEETCRLKLPEWVTADGNDEPATVVNWLRRLRDDFPMITLALEDERLQGEGEAYWREKAEHIQARAERELERARKLTGQHSGQTLHEAFDGFWEWLKTKPEYADGDGRLTLTGQVAEKDVALLKRQHQDIPLRDFDLNAIEAMINHWARRPMSQKNRPMAVKTCKNMIKRIRTFIRWLHRVKSFAWRKPEDYEVLPVRISTTPGERAAKVNGDQVATYTDAELVTLWRYAKPRERLLMLLGLNCGFGIAEASTLQISEIHIDKPHRKYGDQGSWIMRLRGKTGVYGEFRLWDATVEGIRWYLSVRPKTKETSLFVDDQGKALAQQTSGGNRAQGIPNQWGKVVERIRKLEEPSFRAGKSCSFNKLRKTSTQGIEEVSGSGETAGYFGCRGQPVPTDGLLDVYRNRDFRRVHEACRLWGERLAPMFAAVAEPWEKPKRKHKKPDAYLEQRARVVALRREGKQLQEIADTMGISFRTVRYHLDHAGEVKRRARKTGEGETEGAASGTVGSGS